MFALQTWARIPVFAAAWASTPTLGVLGTSVMPPRRPLLFYQAYLGVFQDSGCWDTFILVTFDHTVRSVAQGGGGWVLAHGVAERAGQKLLRELASESAFGTTHYASSVVGLLRVLLLGCLLLACLVGVLMCGCLWGAS